MLLSPDYAQFKIENGNVVASDFLQKKLDCIRFPNVENRRVLDVGCDYGQMSFIAHERGAYGVVGLDRNREVRGKGPCNLVRLNNHQASKTHPRCKFLEYDIGKQWPFSLGVFDVVFMMSMYHHVYANCGDHNAIFYWLWAQCSEGATVIWENPVDLTDPISDKHIPIDYKFGYCEEEIRKAASRYFEIEEIGLGHVGTRRTWHLHAKPHKVETLNGQHKPGAGGASKCFKYEDGRRMKEIEYALGIKPVPGSLNLHMESNFDWENDYVTAHILDVVDRGKGLDSDWYSRQCRFYPVLVDNVQGFLMRFPGEKYPKSFLEVVSNRKLRDTVKDFYEVSFVRPE